jgi:DNA-binding NtrC family response regulator
MAQGMATTDHQREQTMKQPNGSGRGKRILVVDDDPSIRQTLHIALTKAGYSVVGARDGEEAIQLWRAQGADLVIADIYMPKKGGLQVIKELQAHRPSPPVIAMTDGGRTKNLNPLSHAELMGGVQTIAKPFSLEKMLAAVEEALTER